LRDHPGRSETSLFIAHFFFTKMDLAMQVAMAHGVTHTEHHACIPAFPLGIAFAPSLIVVPHEGGGKECVQPTRRPAF
jgi:hypothetical protein